MEHFMIIVCMCLRLRLSPRLKAIDDDEDSEVPTENSHDTMLSRSSVVDSPVSCVQCRRMTTMASTTDGSICSIYCNDQLNR